MPSSPRRTFGYLEQPVIPPEDRITVMLLLKRTAVKAKNTPPIVLTSTNCGQTVSTLAPRWRIACASVHPFEIDLQSDQLQ